MKKDDRSEMLKEMMRHPGWLVLEDRIKVMLENADKKYHSSNAKTFEGNKGYYEGIKAVHYLVVENPLELINENGVTKLGGNDGPGT